MDEATHNRESVLTRRLAGLMVADWLLLLLLSIPWLLAPWPIGVDLPQHAAQIELLGRALGGDPTLEVAWYTPNSLVYWPLAGSIWLFGPLTGTKVTSWLLIASAALLSLRLCRMRGTQVAFGVVAAAFLFNANLYWGFLPFQLGWVVFVGWLMMMLSRRPTSAGWLAALTAVHLALLAAHSLWFAAAAIAGVAIIAVRPSASRERVVRGLTAVPAAAIAAWWAPQVKAQREALRFDVSARWVNGVEVRFTPEFFSSAAFGEIHGYFLTAAVAAVIVTLLVLSQLRPDDVPARSAIDRELLTVGALMIVAVFVLPDIYMNSTDFARRWVPYGCALLVIGGVAELVPRWGNQQLNVPAVSSLVGVLPLVIVVGWTTRTWRVVATSELEGLRDSLAAIGEFDEPRTIGLNFIKRSRYIGGVPFLQQFAWSQAIHGGALNFSFTQHGSGLVHEVDPQKNPWMPGLEWQPNRFRWSDLEYFDVMLVGGPAHKHERFEKSSQLEQLTDTDVWRAYRVK